MTNRAVWKFPIETTYEQVVQMPPDVKLLTVQVQYGKPCLWAEVEEHDHKVNRLIYIHGTGHPFTHDGIYVGSYHLADGALVFHVYDAGQESDG
jgi:hypothetical protein